VEEQLIDAEIDIQQIFAQDEDAEGGNQPPMMGTALRARPDAKSMSAEPASAMQRRY